jgi:lipoate-protein ligase A
LTWHIWSDAAGRPGPDNMAIDLALLADAEHTGRAWLRLYGWAPPCLSLGRNEPALRRYDRGAIERLNIAVVRRPTGGRAVWHDREVTYAVAAPLALFGSLAAGYRAIHERLAAALRRLGAPAELAPAARTAAREGGCFAAPVGGEIVVGGRKLVGSAQVQQGTAFLQHGSILLDGSQDVVGAVSRQPAGVSRETTLRRALGRDVPFDEVARAVAAVWRGDAAPAFVVPPRPSPSVFSDPAWTWRR